MNAGYVVDRPYTKIPIVSVIIFVLNLIGLIYEYAVGDRRSGRDINPDTAGTGKART